MLLTKDVCDDIISRAFKGYEVPEYTVEDVNRVYDTLRPCVQEVIFKYFVIDTPLLDIGKEESKSYSYVYKLLQEGLKAYQRAHVFNWYADDYKVTERSPIAVLDLPNSVLNALGRNGIRVVGDLTLLSYEELAELRGLGKLGIASIMSELAKYLFTLSEVPSKLRRPGNKDFSVKPEITEYIKSYCRRRVAEVGPNIACVNCNFCLRDTCIFTERPYEC